MLLLFSIGCITINKGSYVGYVTTVETNPFGFLNIYIKTTLESSDEIEICAESHLEDILEQAMMSKKNIRIYYKTSFLTLGCFNDNTIVYNLEFVGDNK